MVSSRANWECICFIDILYLYIYIHKQKVNTQEEKQQPYRTDSGGEMNCHIVYCSQFWVYFSQPFNVTATRQMNYSERWVNFKYIALSLLQCFGKIVKYKFEIRNKCNRSINVLYLYQLKFKNLIYFCHLSVRFVYAPCAMAMAVTFIVVVQFQVHIDLENLAARSLTFRCFEIDKNCCLCFLWTYSLNVCLLFIKWICWRM